MPGLLARPSAIARALGLGMVVASVVLLGLAAVPALGAQGSSTTGEAPLIYWKQRSFKIPFNLSAAQKSRIKEVILLVSQDRGESWKGVSRTDADHNVFSFRAKQDGEYWFTVQTRTTDGKVSPGLDSSVEPRMKIVIDTVPPTLVLEPDKRRGSTAAVRWEAKDEHLDLRSMVLEYQVEGVGVWNRVPIARPKRIGLQAWDAGTSEAVRVRMSVADRAGNLADAMLNLPDGIGDPPEAAPAPPENGGPPNIEQISGTVPVPPQITAGQGFTPVDDEAPPSRPESAPSTPTAPARPRSTGGARNRARPTPSAWDRDPGSPASPAGSATVAASASVSPGAGSNAPPELFPTANPAPRAEGGSGIFPAGAAEGPGAPPATGAPAESARPAAAMSAQAAGSGASTLLVNSPRFKLQYAVDDAGPNGPATVELWITHDGGRTWIRRGDDPDRTSPIDVDLGGEGTYGISLVARSAAGLGDQPPAPGRRPGAGSRSTPPRRPCKWTLCRSAPG